MNADTIWYLRSFMHRIAASSSVDATACVCPDGARQDSSKSSCCGPPYRLGVHPVRQADQHRGKRYPMSSNRLSLARTDAPAFDGGDDANPVLIMAESIR